MSSSLIGDIPFKEKITSSCKSMANISFNAFSIASGVSGKFLRVVSKSIVALLSNPTRAATSIPPFNTNFSLYSETDSLFKNRSNI